MRSDARGLPFSLALEAHQPAKRSRYQQAQQHLRVKVKVHSNPAQSSKELVIAAARCSVFAWQLAAQRIRLERQPERDECSLAERVAGPI
jgi:hypothetical protein